MGARPSDREVVDEVLEGKRERFRVLLERYERYLFSIVSRHVPQEYVEEVAQEAAVQLYLSLPGFKGNTDGEFKGWLASVTVRAAYSFWRERYKKREVTMDSLGEEQKRWVEQATYEESEERFQEMARQEEARQVLYWAMDRLSPEERMVLQLTHLEGHPVKEAARLLGWSTAKAKVRSFRARRKLRGILKGLVEV